MSSSTVVGAKLTDLIRLSGMTQCSTAARALTPDAYAKMLAVKSRPLT